MWIKMYKLTHFARLDSRCLDTGGYMYMCAICCPYSVHVHMYMYACTCTHVHVHVHVHMYNVHTHMYNVHVHCRGSILHTYNKCRKEISTLWAAMK